jgi:hypothetical protein
MLNSDYFAKTGFKKANFQFPIQIGNAISDFCFFFCALGLGGGNFTCFLIHDAGLPQIGGGNFVWADGRTVIFHKLDPSAVPSA